MRQQEATGVVSLPLATVESRLRDVESWTRFLPAVGSIRYTSHERYLFTLADRHDHREITTVVRLRHREHCFVWYGLAGPSSPGGIKGAIKLTPVGERLTGVTLRLAVMPGDFRGGMAEMLMPNANGSTVRRDLQLLERHLREDFPVGV